jgi:hypothetical protein
VNDKDNYIKYLESQIQKLQDELENAHLKEDEMSRLDELFLRENCLKTLIIGMDYIKLSDPVVMFHSQLKKMYFPLEYRVEIEKLKEELEDERDKKRGY